MRDWTGCPDCWGTGLVGGFQVECDRRWTTEEIARQLLSAAVDRVTRRLNEEVLDRMLRQTPLDTGRDRPRWDYHPRPLPFVQEAVHRALSLFGERSPQLLSTRSFASPKE